MSPKRCRISKHPKPIFKKPIDPRVLKIISLQPPKPKIHVLENRVLSKTEADEIRTAIETPPKPTTKSYTIYDEPDTPQESINFADVFKPGINFRARMNIDDCEDYPYKVRNQDLIVSQLSKRYPKSGDQMHLNEIYQMKLHEQVDEFIIESLAGENLDEWECNQRFQEMKVMIMGRTNVPIPRNIKSRVESVYQDDPVDPSQPFKEFDGYNLDSNPEPDFKENYLFSDIRSYPNDPKKPYSFNFDDKAPIKNYQEFKFEPKLNTTPTSHTSPVDQKPGILTICGCKDDPQDKFYSQPQNSSYENLYLPPTYTPDEFPSPSRIFPEPYRSPPHEPTLINFSDTNPGYYKRPEINKYGILTEPELQPSYDSNDDFPSASRIFPEHRQLIGETITTYSGYYKRTSETILHQTYEDEFPSPSSIFPEPYRKPTYNETLNNYLNGNLGYCHQRPEYNKKHGILSEAVLLDMEQQGVRLKTP